MLLAEDDDDDEDFEVCLDCKRKGLFVSKAEQSNQHSSYHFYMPLMRTKSNEASKVFFGQCQAPFD